MLIELIRHGLTALNAAGCYQGSTDEPLSPAGAAALHPAGYCPKTVYVSPLCRTAQTAKYIFPEAGQIVVPGLAEMDFGAFEGRSFAQMEHDAAYRKWVDGGCLGRCPGGESKEEFTRRVQGAFAALVDEALARGENYLVIVAHGGTQMAALEGFARPRRDFFAWQTKPGCGWVLDASRWQAERLLTVTGETNYTEG